METIDNFSCSVLVIGAGHAGVEAAAAASRMGATTILVTLRKDRIGYMPCNPAIGGIGKGHIVFEIAALGGVMPQVCTSTYLQAKMLNTRKGPAVQGLRLQIDKHAYQKAIQTHLEGLENLVILEDMVTEIVTDKQQGVVGVKTRSGRYIATKTVIITGGTFFNGLVHIGQESHAAGRIDEDPVVDLADCLKKLGLRTSRMKTGTPPRLLRSSINFSLMERDEVEPLGYLFEFAPHQATTKADCFITYTNPQAHQIILDNAHLSPIFSKKITGTPTRYCPSIEDKIVRFSSKEAHHVFIEPESLSTEDIYPNGISNSLPKSVQEEFVRSIKGLEHAIFTDYAYGIEYDFVHPEQLKHTLETREISGLFCAGQINGTTGYEEAAGQGIIAGINAALKVKGQEPYVMSRNEGYIGIMIDDLVSMGVDEPYRMFTSRAERRLILRQDNAFERLYQSAYKLGLISSELHSAIEKEAESVHNLIKDLGATKRLLQFAQLISNNKPELVKQELQKLSGHILSPRSLETAYAEILYGPYKQRELREIAKSENLRALTIPSNLAFDGMSGLSRELQEKLNRHRPQTIGQAALIPGMTPATISLLIFKVRELSRTTLQ